MSRQEDFNNQTDKYANERKSFGVNDPYALKEIGEAHCQGAEYGYQYAVEKAREWLESLSGYVVCGQKANVENFLRAMEEGL